MYLFVIFTGLVNFLVSALFGRFIGRLGSVFIIFFFNIVCLVCCFFIYYEVVFCEHQCFISLYEWIVFDRFNCKFGFFFDSLTSFMLLVVNVVSFFTQLYSVEYMKNDSDFVRFMSYLNLFTFFMNLLISSSTLVLMFVGWEGVGICSYLLINFWFTRVRSNKAAFLAVITNRVGDFGFLLACFFIYFLFGTFSIYVILSV